MEWDFPAPRGPVPQISPRTCFHRYDGLASYGAAKARDFRRRNHPDDVAVPQPTATTRVGRALRPSTGRPGGFLRLVRMVEEGSLRAGGRLIGSFCALGEGPTKERFPLRDMGLPRVHNVEEGSCAAVWRHKAVAVEGRHIREAARKFRGIEPPTGGSYGSLDGGRLISNDSKHQRRRVQKCVASFDGPHLPDRPGGTHRAAATETWAALVRERGCAS